MYNDSGDMLQMNPDFLKYFWTPDLFICSYFSLYSLDYDEAPLIDGFHLDQLISTISSNPNICLSFSLLSVPKLFIYSERQASHITEQPSDDKIVVDVRVRKYRSEWWRRHGWKGLQFAVKRQVSNGRKMANNLLILASLCAESALTGTLIN